MTPKFWKYLITNCKGSAIRVVAEQDRECAEKELEGNSHLLVIEQNHNFNPQCSAVLPNEY